jgi:hypothetical protein
MHAILYIRIICKLFTCVSLPLHPFIMRVVVITKVRVEARLRIVVISPIRDISTSHYAMDVLFIHIPYSYRKINIAEISI